MTKPDRDLAPEHLSAGANGQGGRKQADSGAENEHHTTDLSHLGDRSYERILMANLPSGRKKSQTWRTFTNEHNIERTRTVLVKSYERARSHKATIVLKREELERECFARGRRGREELLETRGDYESLLLRTDNFVRLMASSISEVNLLRKKVNIAAQGKGERAHRELVRKLAQAIERHRVLTMQGGNEPSVHDTALWDVLDGIAVADGPDQQNRSLREMLAGPWAAPAATGSDGNTQ